MHKATRDRKRMELLHDVKEGRLLRYIRTETGWQVRMHVRNLLETEED